MGKRWGGGRGGEREGKDWEDDEKEKKEVKRSRRIMPTLVGIGFSFSRTVQFT